MLIVDVDLLQLKELHEHGSVQVLKDRRTDLYDVVMRKKSKPKVTVVPPSVEVVR